MNPVHRDDLSPEIINRLEERFPGMQIVCVGDLPLGDISPDAIERLEGIKKLHDRSIAEGICVDCGVKMPGYPDLHADLPDDWKPAEGWSWFEQDDQIAAWQCPECGKKEKNSP